jgi:hypothetical protein
MTTLVQTAADAAQPWADLYGNSAVVQTAVTFLHFAGLLTAGGFAVATDRGVLRHSGRSWTDRTGFLREVTATHRVVIAALAVVVASGVCLLAADVEALLPSPVFWAKMALFGALLLNGLSMRRAEKAIGLTGPPVSPCASPPESPPDAGATGIEAGPHDGERHWRALRNAALRSAALWFAVLFLGTLLTSAA